MPDPLFDSMIAAAESLRWAPADELRDRARRRTRRTRIATAVAAFTAVAVVVGGVAMAGADRAAPPPVPGGSSGPPAAPSTPSSSSQSSTGAPSQEPTGAASQGSTSVTSARFLQPADLGSGWTSTRVDNGDGDWIIEAAFSFAWCAKDGWASGLTDNRQTRDLRKGSDAYKQWVGLFPRNKAAAYLDTIRTQVRDCDPIRPDTKIDLAAERFAGDDALLVDFNIEGVSSRYVVVRRGEMVALIWTKGSLPDAAAKDLGRKAAARLGG